MNDFITIEQAKQITGKSDKTIRRLVGHLSSQKSTQRLVKKDDKRRWLISSKCFNDLDNDQEPDQVNDQAVSSQMSTQMPSHDLAIFQGEMLDILKAQLEEKDRQIEQLNERLREAHILNREIQQRLLPVPQAERLEEIREPEEPEKEAPQPVVQEPEIQEEPPKKRSLWKIILRAISQ